VWVANAGNSVTELSASTGKLVEVLSNSRYKFDFPNAVASDAKHVWVANENGQTVTELSASTGRLVRVRSSSSYGFNSPDAIASDGINVWVTNADQSVTGFPAR
jgi:DNA-binding beta-propeller fold protein YncE